MQPSSKDPHEIDLIDPVLSLTSMCDDPEVGPDDLHVNTMLLFSDDHRPPEASVVDIPLLIHVF